MHEERKKKDLKIIVVEDSLMDFELIESALVNQLSCDVHLVMTKSQFEEELAEKKPDIIVSDSNVAGFDGFAALTLAGERCPDVPFVFCSGSPSTDRLKKNLRRDVGWVSKDNGFAGLIAFVKKAIDSKKSGQS